MELNRKAALGWLLALLMVDTGLTLAALSSDTLSSGTSSALDSWDLAKALILSGVLATKAIRLRSYGLGATAVMAFLVGLASTTRLHAILAGYLPDSVGGLGKFVVLSALVVLGVLTILMIRDKWPGFSHARRAILLLLLGLWLFAGVFDALAPGTLGDLLEESGERVVVSICLSLSLAIPVDPSNSSDGAGERA